TPLRRASQWAAERSPAPRHRLEAATRRAASALPAATSFSMDTNVSTRPTAASADSTSGSNPATISRNAASIACRRIDELHVQRTAHGEANVCSMVPGPYDRPQAQRKRFLRDLSGRLRGANRSVRGGLLCKAKRNRLCWELCLALVEDEAAAEPEAL